MTGLQVKFVSFLGGFIATFFDLYGVILALVAIVIVFDVVTGVVASKATGVQLSSKMAYQGFWKKIGLMLALFFGVFLDVFIPIALEFASVELPFDMPFGMIFGCYIVFNEALSVCENFYKINPDILPSWVKKMLEGGAHKLGLDHEEVEEDGNQDI